VHVDGLQHTPSLVTRRAILHFFHLTTVLHTLSQLSPLLSPLLSRGELVERPTRLAILHHHKTKWCYLFSLCTLDNVCIHHRGVLCWCISSSSSSSSISSSVSSNSSGSRHQTAMSGNTNIRPVFVYITPKNSDVSENRQNEREGRCLSVQ
jgi:hypothetical protein